jgi:alpha-ketoglutarate-dependent taurine dioxygenase
VVQTSTDYPSDHPIQFHSEFSYSNHWPMRILFCCLQPAESGGQTPLADARNVFRRLRPDTRERFLEHRVLYCRNFIRGLGVDWKTAFGTSERSRVAALCDQLGIVCRWEADDVLRTRQVADAIVRHPITREQVWFNHAYFFNVRALEPAELREFMLEEPEEQLSTNTYFGDGTPLPAEVIEEIGRAYAAESVEFDWQRGDLLLIDNMLTAHARRPFTGAREVLAVMADGMLRGDLPG